MAQTNDILTEIAIKRLSGKAQTSTKLSLAQESFGSTVQSTAATIFAQAVPNNPSTSSPFEIQSDTVEQVIFELSAIPDSLYQNVVADGDGETTVFTYHAYALKLTGSYQSLTDNPLAGTAPFTNGYHMSGSLGKLQIVPSYLSNIAGPSNPYRPILYSTLGTEMSDTDSTDWYLDTYAGILFLQDPLDYGTPGSPNAGAQIPGTVKAFIYTGQFLDSGSGGTGTLSGSISQITDYEVTASVSGLTPNSVFLVTSGSETLLQLNNQGDLQIFGNLIAEQYIISSSVTYYTQSFASGSNVFGDDITDTHIFTGSLFVTGSKIETMSQTTTTFIAYIETGSGEIKFSNIIDGGTF